MPSLLGRSQGSITVARLLEALSEYHQAGRYGVHPARPPAGSGTDVRVREVMGIEPFRDDVLASTGLDDRSSSGGYLEEAEELMADAVGAEHAFFSTCGSSLSVKAAMLAVAGHDGHLLTDRDAHKPVVAGLRASALLGAPAVGSGRAYRASALRPSRSPRRGSGIRTRPER